jgi:acyl carrier protein
MYMTMATVPGQLDVQVREILQLHGRLRVNVNALHDTDDLYRAGLGSHANVTVMLALEEAFGVEFPDEMLRKATFESMSSIRQAIRELLAAQGHKPGQG